MCLYAYIVLEIHASRFLYIQEDVKIAPPGKRTASIRVRHVEFEPAATKSTPNRFLALEGRKIYLWDLGAEKVSAQETVC
jgi:hypothetical protein